MPKVSIVTDSTAHFFDPAFPGKNNVTVIPLTIQFGAQTFNEGMDIDNRTFFQRVAAGAPLPVAVSPTVEQFAALYEDLSRTTDKIVSIHVSGKLSRTPHNARAGAESVKGRCKVEVIDSLSTSVGLGMLVEAAGLAARRGDSLEDVVRLVRGMVPRLYTVFFIETLDFLAQAGRIGKAQAVLGAMLGIKPFLTLEEGDILPMEKVRTRQQAIEKIVEFVVEFADIETMAILQSAPAHTDDTRLLLERLAMEFPARTWPVLAYGPSLGTFLGPDAMGVIILDGSADPDRDSGGNED